MWFNSTRLSVKIKENGLTDLSCITIVLQDCFSYQLILD